MSAPSSGTASRAVRRRLPAAERRQGILAAALDVFASAGFHEASLDDVAARAQVSKALIYEHFASKRELYEALLETYVHELLARVTEATEGTEPGEPRMRAGLEGFLEFVEARRDAWRMLIRHSESVGISSAVGRLFDESVAVIGGRMAEEVPGSVLPRGFTVERLAEVMARQLLGAVTELANWWDEHREVPREEVLAVAMDFAWVGLDRIAAGHRWGPATGP